MVCIYSNIRMLIHYCEFSFIDLWMIFIFCWTHLGVVMLHVMIQKTCFLLSDLKFSQLQVKISVFWYVVLHSLVDVYRHLWGACCPKYQGKQVSHMERISQWYRIRKTSVWAKRELAPIPDHQGGNRDWAPLQEPELEGLLLPKQATETCHLLSEGAYGAS